MKFLLINRSLYLFNNLYSKYISPKFVMLYHPTIKIHLILLNYNDKIM